MTLQGACALLVYLLRQLRAAQQERDSYRELAQEAIHALHGVTTDRDRSRHRVADLCEQRRAAGLEDDDRTVRARRRA